MAVKQGEVIGRVLFFDPNNIGSIENKGADFNTLFGGDSIVNAPEDMSIFVDLEVEKKVRKNIANSESSKKVNISFTSTSSKERINNGAGNGGDKFLTSYFTDITYSDKDDEFKDEALSINSIDIEFSSWYVASVIIKFTDVRGAALFSQSEKAYEDGSTNMSSFSSFFSMPYPLFKLKIKGFYGKIVTYPLHLQDFKSEYNSEKGNFDITAQFIGYTYAILSDIQLAYLVSAPYTKDYGDAYWESQVDNGRFLSLEGAKLPKIPELLKRIKEGESVVNSLTAASDLVKTSSEYSQKKALIDVIKSSIESVVDYLKSKFTVSYNQAGYGYKIEGDGIDSGMSKYPHISKSLTETARLIASFNNSYPNENVFSGLSDFKTAYESLSIKNANGKEGYFNPTGIISSINKFIETYENKIGKLNEEIGDNVRSNITSAYGIKPSIYNLFKIVIAHFETLMHVIGQCSNAIISNQNRPNIGGNNVNNTDLNSEVKNKPFPWYSINDTDVWIGDYFPEIEEVRLVESFMKAREGVLNNINAIAASTIVSDIDTSDSTLSVGDVWYPINAFDNSISINNNGIVNRNPYDIYLDEFGSNINELKSLLSTRIASIVLLSLSESEYSKLLNSYALSESKNIIQKLGNSIAQLDNVLTALDNIKKDSLREDDYTHIRSSLVKNAPQFPMTTGSKLLKYNFKYNNRNILPLNYIPMRRVKEISSIMVDGFLSSGVYYYSSDINDTNSKSYQIIDGYENCEIINNQWIAPIELAIEQNQALDIKPILRRISTKREDSIKSLTKDKIYNATKSYIEKGSNMNQPVMNRLLYKRIASSSGGGNSQSLNELYQKSIGTDYLSEKVTHFDENIFGEYNNTSGLYNLYLNCSTIKDAENVKSEDVTPEKIFTEKTFENYSYPVIGGLCDYPKKRNRPSVTRHEWTTDTFCLFGHPMFYKQSDYLEPSVTDEIYKSGAVGEQEKNYRNSTAYLFLQSISVNLTSLDGMVTDGNESTFVKRMPKVEALLLGSMLWRKKFMSDKNNDPIKTYFSQIESTEIMSMPDSDSFLRVGGLFYIKLYENTDTKTRKKPEYDKCNLLKVIYGDVRLRDTLINYFNEWASSSKYDEEASWAHISYNLSIKNKNGLPLKAGEVVALIDNVNYEHFNTGLSQEFFNNYLIVRKLNELSLMLVHKDNSPGMTGIVNLLSQEVTILSAGNAILTSPLNTPILNGNSVDLLIDRIKYYIEDRKREISDVSKPLNTNSSNSETKHNLSITSSSDLKIISYRYLKNIYDKWVSGYEFNTTNSEYKWISTAETYVNNIKTYDIKNFNFIDRAYTRIGGDMIVDYTKFFNDIVNSTNHNTLYSIITSILADNNFLFLPMPNYQKWGSLDDFMGIFKPIPYAKAIENDSDGDIPSMFQCMYTGNPSKNLDIPESDFKNDSFDLRTPPIDFNDTSSQDSIPAFAVSNGRGNQSYFKSISVNQTNPVTTEASINALKNIVNRSDRDSAVSSLTQDLYTVYSQYAYTCQVEMLGCPQIQPMMYFQLTNIPMWNGAYLIYKVNHSIRPGHMTTNFTGMRMARSKPKLISPLSVSSNDLNTIMSNTTYSSSIFNEEDYKKKVGSYFTLSEYTTKKDENDNFSFGKVHHIAPSIVVARIYENLAPVIDKIQDSWMKTSEGNLYGKFRITSGYRPDDINSSHYHGLAVDIQLNGPNQEKNTVLSNHIKVMMESGEIKIDQLINEKISGHWCHVSPASIRNNMIEVRGQYFEEDSNGRTGEIAIIKKASSPSKPIGKESGTEIQRFLTYWKNVENNNKTGWNQSKKLWFSHNSVEGGESTIAYGIKLISNSFSSNELKTKITNDTISSYENGSLGITESEAVNEITSRTMHALNSISVLIGEKHFVNMENKIKYALCDFYLNLGEGGFKQYKKMIECAKAGNIDEMIRESKRSYINKKGERVELTTRNEKFAAYLRG